MIWDTRIEGGETGFTPFRPLTFRPLNSKTLKVSTMPGISLPETTPTQKLATLAGLKSALRKPPVPVPEESLRLLYDTACMDSGGSQAARSFLFWLAGQPDPTGFVGDGGLELRRLDHPLKIAVFEVVAWWSGPTQSDQPLYGLLGKLRARFAQAEPDSGGD